MYFKCSCQGWKKMSKTSFARAEKWFKETKWLRLCREVEFSQCRLLLQVCQKHEKLPFRCRTFLLQKLDSFEEPQKLYSQMHFLNWKLFAVFFSCLRLEVRQLKCLRSKETKFELFKNKMYLRPGKNWLRWMLWINWRLAAELDCFYVTHHSDLQTWSKLAFSKAIIIAIKVSYLCIFISAKSI